MQTWLIILFSLFISLLLKSLLNILKYPSKKKPHKNLPPGPPTIPIVGNFQLLSKSFAELEPILQTLHAKFGSMVTLHIGSNPAIFVADRSLIHKALVQNGAVFADRPTAIATAKIDRSNQHTINTAPYGSTWRLLRRNLTAEILHPSRVKSYSHARNWVLQILKERLKSKFGYPIRAVDHLRYAMFCLLALMCFGDKLDEKHINEIEDGQRRFLLKFERFNILMFWPSVTKFVFRNRWDEFLKIRQNQENVLIPLIRARKKVKDQEEKYMLSYVDTLLDLELPEEKRKLDESEMVSLCSEFLNGGTDTTSTALQWIMANLVKYQNIQEKLFMEIKRVVGEGVEEVKEDDLNKMPYLKAIILEGLRRHPPAHFVLPQSVTEDTVLGGFLVPKKGTINFMIAEMGWDPKVWEDPMEFKPERFLSSELESIDLTGSKEIKMMPFGVGRRICPALGLAILHLEYFVANLILCFEWNRVDGDEVDLSEKQEFTMVMKNPLQTLVYPRLK